MDMTRSAGILMYRGRGSELSLLLVHPGGPFWAKKDLGAWPILKGEYADAEDPLACAIRQRQLFWRSAARSSRCRPRCRD
jgi:predicted NUDIX family NTP pyrophosphohydrolase